MQSRTNEQSILRFACILFRSVAARDHQIKFYSYILHHLYRLQYQNGTFSQNILRFYLSVFTERKCRHSTVIIIASWHNCGADNDDEDEGAGCNNIGVTRITYSNFHVS